MKENNFLCESCFAREQRRASGDKNSAMILSDDESSQNASLISLELHSLSHKKIRVASLSLKDSIETSALTFSHSTPIVNAKESMINSM